MAISLRSNEEVSSFHPLLQLAVRVLISTRLQITCSLWEQRRGRYTNAASTTGTLPCVFDEFRLGMSDHNQSSIPTEI